MTFSHLPPLHAIAQRAVFAAAYACTALAGAAALVFTPTTIAGTLGLWVTYVWAALAIVGGPVGLLAVATGRWRLELWAAPLATGGAAGYAIGVWSLVNGETVTRLTQASWITVLVLLLLARVIHVRAVASEQRRRHDRHRRVRRILDDGED